MISKYAALICCLIFPLVSGAQIYDTNNVVVQTFAGSGFSGYVDGQGQQTMFNSPKSLASDSSGDLFILDASNMRVREISPTGLVSTFAGGGNQASGYGTNATVIYGGANSIAIDPQGSLWIPSNSGSLVRIGADGFVSTTFLNGLSYPFGSCCDSVGNVYVADYYGQKIWRQKTNGSLEVFVGSGNTGSADGSGIFTSFNTPWALAVDAADNVYVWDYGNHVIRKVDQSRNVTTIAGRLGVDADVDGAAKSASFSHVGGMKMDSSGNLILACGTSVRRMSPSTNVTTIAGAFGQAGFTNGSGIMARFNGANDVAIYGGVIFVADSANQRIRSISFDPSTQSVSAASLSLNTYAGLQIAGTVGRSYQVQSSPDMNSWDTRATLFLNQSPYLWIDQNPIAGNKYYRALLLR